MTFIFVFSKIIFNKNTKIFPCTLKKFKKVNRFWSVVNFKF